MDDEICEPDQGHTYVLLNADGHGLGDVVINCWISEGSKGTNRELIQHATGEKRKLLEMFGQRVAVNVQPWQMQSMNAMLDYELRKSCSPRIRARAEFLKIRSEHKRPPVILSERNHKWAENQKHKETTILVFPFTRYANRQWPIPLWLDLISQFQQMHEVEAKVFIPEPDERFSGLADVYWGQDWGNMAALMLKSALVIGNDSGPIHISGTLDVPSLAICGPTDAFVFTHLDSVRVISSGMNCEGCYFKSSAYNAAVCSHGCASLHALTTNEVIDRCLDIVFPQLPPEEGIQNGETQSS